MAEPQATESVAGPLYELASEETTPTRDAVAAAAALSIGETYQTYLDVSAAGHSGYGAAGVYSNGRYREHSSPRVGTRNRDSSAERCTGTGNPPCGIMKVSECHHFVINWGLPELCCDANAHAAVHCSVNTLCSIALLFLYVSCSPVFRDMLAQNQVRRIPRTFCNISWTS